VTLAHDLLVLLFLAVVVLAGCGALAWLDREKL
jgi:hypothetical protein